MKLRIRIFLTFAVVVIGLTFPGCAFFLNSTKSVDETVVGIYDSRIIALAYWQGEGMTKVREMQKQLRPVYEKAKKEGNDSLVKEIDQKMGDFHINQTKQVFSYQKPVEALEYISDKLPGIMKQEGVDVIVSKWKKEELAKYGVVGSGWDENDFVEGNPNKVVEITETLVQLFNPRDSFYEKNEEFRKSKPAPLDTEWDPNK